MDSTSSTETSRKYFWEYKADRRNLGVSLQGRPRVHPAQFQLLLPAAAVQCGEQGKDLVSLEMPPHEVRTGREAMRNRAGKQEGLGGPFWDSPGVSRLRGSLPPVSESPF